MKATLLVFNVLLVGVIAWLLATRPPVAPAENTKSGGTIAVTFQPSGEFTEAERREFFDRVVSPYGAYAQCMQDELPVSMMVTRVEAPGYRYAVNAVFAAEEAGTAAGYYGFLVGPQEGELDYWVPEFIMKRCVDVLPNADELRDRAIGEYQG